MGTIWVDGDEHLGKKSKTDRPEESEHKADCAEPENKIANSVVMHVSLPSNARGKRRRLHRLEERERLTGVRLTELLADPSYYLLDDDPFAVNLLEHPIVTATGQRPTGGRHENDGYRSIAGVARKAKPQD